jgi:hypothetical protein
MKVTNGARSVKSALMSLAALASLAGVSACSSLQVAGNDTGSEPINSEEQREYMKEIRRCHKMGGTRIVKVQGELRCF